MRCNKCENMKNNNCKVVYNTPVYQKHHNINSLMTERFNRENRSHIDAYESIMIKCQSLVYMSRDSLIEHFNQYITIKDAILNINKLHKDVSNDFALIICHSSEDAEYLLRIVSSNTFTLNGYKVYASLSKLSKDAFQQLYGNINQIESIQEQNYQQQQYLQQYYQSFYKHIYDNGYYYDHINKMYKRLDDDTRFDKIEIDDSSNIIPNNMNTIIDIDIIDRPIEDEDNDNITYNNTINNIQYTQPVIKQSICHVCRRMFTSDIHLSYHIKYSNKHKQLDP